PRPRIAPMRKTAVSTLVLLLLFLPASLPSADGPPSFTAAVKANFEKWDLDRDGELSLAEAERAVADPAAKGADAAAAVALRGRLRGKNTKGERLTLPKVVAAASDFEPAYRAALSRMDAAKRDLFVGGEAPDLDSLHQGKLGDCFCLAALGAAVHRDPKSV